MLRDLTLGLINQLVIGGDLFAIKEGAKGWGWMRLSRGTA